MREIAVPNWLDHEEIRERADQFLEEHACSGTYPVPIEDIIDTRLGIHIVPIPALMSDHDIDGFITSDRSEIRVDWDIHCSDRSYFRYRFTLAHELGHLVLHRDLLDRAAFQSTDEWRGFVDDFPEPARTRYETQAYIFGGLVLVQQDPLQRELERALEVAALAGTDLDLQNEADRKFIARQVGRKFEVSQHVILKRGERDGHW